jgi:hypothetical protein
VFSVPDHFVMVLSLLSSSGSPVAPTEEIRQVIVKQQTPGIAATSKRSAGYWNSPDLTFSPGARESKVGRRHSTVTRRVIGAGHEMGKLEFANLRIEMLGPEAAFVQAIPSDDVRWEDSTQAVHFDLPEIPEGWKIIHDQSAGE